jgi:ankyrin repeat protein
MILPVCIFIIFSLPFVRADGWDDFSNNLATDLAPFLSLFGEQVTKQYLSESITFLDYFIFAMAPMGILTAVVSAIRVCGGPSLRAFIGRAQEGGGNAEAELCSSTSRDVCELYHNGGIARVFGRPKILEVVFDPDNREPGTAGIYTFQEYLSGKGQERWIRKSSKFVGHTNNDTESGAQKPSATTAFAPNLSLNLGITKQHPVVFWAVALGGLTLQGGVLVFAGVVTYLLRWEKNGTRPDSYACPLTVVGTLLVCSGMFWCAFLIGQSTSEEVWCRKAGVKEMDNSPIHWVQPGGQIIGDQTFDAFSYADCDDLKGPLQEYTTSWKEKHQKNWEYQVWATAAVTISGFVFQFIGLRGLHSAVSVAQLGVIMVMSIARAALRMRRLKPDANSFAEYPDEVIGHEIDWLALRIGEKDIQDDLPPGVPPSFSAASPLSTKEHRYSWKFLDALEPKEGSLNNRLSNFNELNVAAKLLAYRTRLAQLTESPSTHPKSARSPRSFEIGMVEVREMSQRLALAIETTVNTIYSKSAKINKKWESAESMLLGFNCEVSVSRVPNNKSDDKEKLRMSAHNEVLRRSQNTLSLELHRDSTNPSILTNPWRFRNKLEVEALLGLWLWSLKSDPAFETRDPKNDLRTFRAAEIPIRRIVSSDRTIAETDLNIWLSDKVFIGSELELESSIGLSNPSTIWKRKSNGLYEPLLGELPPDLPNEAVRFFGWYAADGSVTQSSEPLKVWSVPVYGSLLSACALEVFGSFVRSTMSIVDEIGTIHIKEDDANFRVENRLVSEIVKSFVETHLGSESDALLCTLPAAIPRLGMPSAEGTLMTAVKSANQYRRMKEYTKAEAILKWALTTCAPGPNYSHEKPSRNLIELAAVTLGEVYRSALRDPQTKTFGISGIERLVCQTSASYRSLPNTLDEIIDRYRIIKEAISTARGFAHIDLLSAVKNGNLTEVLICLTRRTPKIPNEAKGNALCIAATQGWIEVVISLLESATHPDYKDLNSRTALSKAAEYGRAHVVKELLDWGALPNSEDKGRRTPLSWAAENGQETIVKVLLTDARTLTDLRDINGRTPLSWAAAYGHETIVKMLLNKNVDIEAKDNYGRTPLLWASGNGHDSIVKMLLRKHVNIEAKDNYGRTPLLWASGNGHDTIVKMLLRKNVDIEAKDNNGRTPLLRAAYHGHETVVKMLLRKNVDIEAKDNNGRTPLFWAAGNGHETIVKMLLDMNADIEVKDSEGDTPLLWAAEKGHKAIVKILRDKNWDIKAKDNNGRTPLL